MTISDGPDKRPLWLAIEEKISGLRQFFFFNGKINGFLNAISMRPKDLIVIFEALYIS